MPPPRGLLRLAQIRFTSYHPKFVTDCGNDVYQSATQMGLQTSGIVPLPTHSRKYSVLKSPFKYKKAWHQYQHDTHKRLIELYGKSTTGQEATSVVHFLRYLEHTILVLHPACSARILLFSDEMCETLR